MLWAASEDEGHVIVFETTMVQFSCEREMLHLCVESNTAEKDKRSNIGLEQGPVLKMRREPPPSSPHHPTNPEENKLNPC